VHNAVKALRYCNIEGHLHERGLLVQRVDLVHHEAARREARAGGGGGGGGSSSAREELLEVDGAWNGGRGGGGGEGGEGYRKRVC
jgi:hypothetical protein